VQNLVVSSFKDVVTKGRTALENAVAAGDLSMQKAAQGLVSNGERALKKIEPLCKRQVDEYGEGFVDALKENGEFVQCCFEWLRRKGLVSLREHE